MGMSALNRFYTEMQHDLDANDARDLAVRVAELEADRYGTLERRCVIPGCAASYDAAHGPAPDQRWLRTSSPRLLLCPDHTHLWEGDTPHKPALDHATRTCACSCGHPLPGPTLGHMATAWTAHALTLLDDESGPDAWDFSRMEHEADVLQDRIRELEESIRVHRESIARLDSIKAERGARIVELETDVAAAREQADSYRALAGRYWDNGLAAMDERDTRIIALEERANAVRALHACETHYYQAEAPYDTACNHCYKPIRDASGTLTENHFEDDNGIIRCRVRPRRTCTHCFTAQEEEVPWPCDTKIALDGDTDHPEE